MSKLWEVTIRVNRPLGGGSNDTIGQVTTMTMPGPDNFATAKALFEAFGQVLAIREKSGY